MATTRATWRRSYDDVAPIELRDPLAEVLGVLPDGEPFRVEYADAVRMAGHSCPAAAGAFRMVQQGLDALYPHALPVRSDVAVDVGAPRDAHPAGVIARIVSHITGAAGAGGFRGLADGFGGRNGLLTYGERQGEGLRIAFQRLDTGEAVEVAYFLGDVPDTGPAKAYLPAIVAGEATRAQRDEFEAAWHARVDAVLANDDLFAVREVPAFAGDSPSKD